MMTDFQERVFSECKKVPKGRVTTYGDIARKLGTSPRAVGQALKTNRNHAVPCHRVVKSDLTLGGYQGKENNMEKKRMLEKEGVRFEGDRISRGCLV